MIVHGDRAAAEMSAVVPPTEWSTPDVWALFTYRPTGPAAGEWRFVGSASPVDEAARWLWQR